MSESCSPETVHGSFENKETSPPWSKPKTKEREGLALWGLTVNETLDALMALQPAGRKEKRRGLVRPTVFELVEDFKVASISTRIQKQTSAYIVNILSELLMTGQLH